MTRLQTMCARYAKPMTIIRIYSAVMGILQKTVKQNHAQGRTVSAHCNAVSIRIH